MSAVQLPLSQPHNNQQLFSDYYLNETLPRHADWRALIPDARSAMLEIQAKFETFTPSEIEAQTERDFVQPVLEILGHTFEVQASLRSPDGTKTPDYIFYRDRDNQNANKGRVLDDELLRSRAFAVGDAKHWDRKLDTTIKGATSDPFTNKNPSYQISFYMQHSGMEWGILTNGRLWRLYHRDSAHKLDRFYEVDLPALLALDDPEQFLYFYVFFRRGAFEPGQLGVGELLRASIDYAQGVGDKLKLQVFDSLRHLAQGFLDYGPNNLQPDDATLSTIYNNSLIVLYRTLFILYAEARGLLPVRESVMYRDSYSMQAITHEVARDLNANRRLLSTSRTLWPRLAQLFQLIDKGSPPLSVATFNGGLFDPEKHPFLEQYSVGDAHLQQAIDILARVNGQFVDYRDLAEQHLGTIYEGLLEYQLAKIDPEDGWTIAIVNDKGERKTTGSYYTPNYIVKFIVDKTVGPLLQDAVDGKKTDAEKVEAILNLNIVDPAMGSGYFLVEATEYIARFLVDLAIVPESGADEPDLAYWKRRVAQSCIYGVDLNPLAVDLAKLSMWLSTVAKDQPLSFLDHHLRTGNSLIGAWVSDLQVQQKQTARQRRARKQEEVARQAGQTSMLEDDAFRRSMSTAVDSMWLIQESPEDTVEDVKEKERVYAELRNALISRYGRWADLVTATYFGKQLEDDVWKIAVDYVTGRVATLPASLKANVDDALMFAESMHFFHWELEFPEVFFDRRGEPLRDAAGFDAVIGNPPYVRQEVLSPQKPFYEARYPEIYHGVADIFVYFFGQGLRVLRQNGLLSYISSNSWLRANYATPLRSYLRQYVTMEMLVDVGDNRVFRSAPDVYPAIHLTRNSIPADDHAVLAAVFSRREGVKSFEQQVENKLISTTIHDQLDSGWQLTGNTDRQLFAKMSRNRVHLEDIVMSKMYYGIKTGLNKAFIVDASEREQLQKHQSSNEILKPLLQGMNLRPWHQHTDEQWILLIPDGWTKERFGAGLNESDAWAAFEDQYPLIAQHLAPFSEAGQKRYDRGHYWWELRPCAYYPEFEKPKILWPDITKNPRFSYDESGFYLGNTGYILPTDQKWLLGYLASRCAWFLISQTSVALGERAGMNRYRLIDQFMRPLPVPDMSPDAQDALSAIASETTQRAQERYTLHKSTRHRILSDLGTPDKKLNQKLTAWWELDFTSFRSEIKKVFKREIPVRERDEWEHWLQQQQHEHERLTADIIRLETELNEIVYGLFDLTPEEIDIIEESTKYQYGEV